MLARIAPELVERFPLDQLQFLRGNPRRGDHAFLREVLTNLGQHEALVINRGTHTGVANEIVAGNNRAQVMADLGWTECAVTWVDVDELTLKKLSISLNKASEKASWDDHALADLIASIAAESDLIGTGFDDDSYAELMRATDLFGDAAADFLGGLGDDDGGVPAPTPPAPAGNDDEPTARPTPSGHSDGAGAKPTASSDTYDEPSGEGSTSANVSNGYVTMSWTVLPAQRDAVREALKTAQSRWQTGTSAEALVELCDRFNRGDLAK